ncbi:proline--tRNA ligase [Pyrofollis japonicus]|uniref:proline--tRNA ligase n=1 Tax=Pyrofollis japonicus TaxID=3060460 RepID=UPI00295AD0F4|nr:proline--tRNA ligase [Pyrofollis japonicus]BEP17160.1 proline--tRNA ligase [Pyrofollis japonicus]
MCGAAREVPRKKWREEFSRWFDWVLEEAEIYDYGRYPVKGMGIWLPYGFQLRRRIVELIRDVLDSTGHEEILMPLLIPETLLRKESEHIRGFEGEVYWVTHGGKEPLDIKLALRPTSETSISYMESFWIKSYKQLPKKYYQIVSIFRYETKATRPLIRLREVTTFKEAHTVHDSFEDADRQVAEAIELYKKIFDELGIPYVISRRPEWDKFAGALYTVAFDTVMPDGRTLQIGTVHHLGQNFTVPFEIRIQLSDESLDYAWQTSYGLSDRLVATTIAMHGDDRGAVMPPNVAPIQVVVVPIPAGSEEERKQLQEYLGKVSEKLREMKIRYHVDDRDDVRPGRKFYEWEARGVPVRLEVGPREARNSTVVIARRDTFEKIEVKLEELPSKLQDVMEDIRRNLRERAWKWLRSMVKRAETIEEAKRIIEEERGIVELPWCGREECGLKLEELVDAGVLGSPLEKPEWVNGKRCPVCGRPAVTSIRVAKKY